VCLCLREAGNKLHAVFLLESINATAGIQEFLLTREERMASGANLYAKILLNGSRFKRVTACASNRRLMISRMDCLFHCPFTSFALKHHVNQSYTYRDDYSTTPINVASVCSACPIVPRARVCTNRARRPAAPRGKCPAFVSCRNARPAPEESTVDSFQGRYSNCAIE